MQIKYGIRGKNNLPLLCQVDNTIGRAHAI